MKTISSGAPVQFFYSCQCLWGMLDTVYFVSFLSSSQGTFLSFIYYFFHSLILFISFIFEQRL